MKKYVKTNNLTSFRENILDVLIYFDDLNYVLTEIVPAYDFGQVGGEFVFNFSFMACFVMAL